MEEVSFEVSGLRLAAKVWGPKDGRPVLAMHGWLDNAATFDRLAPLLTNHLRIVSLDLPGHGLSQHRSEDAAYAVPDAVVEVAALLHRLGWQRCTLLGHSLGAAIAAILAGTLPQHFDKLVMLEGIGPLNEEPDAAPARLEGAIMEQLRRSGGSQTRVFKDLDDAAARVVQAAPMELSSAKILLARGTQPAPGGITWRTDPRLRSMTRLRLSEAHVAAFMRRIACETLVVLAKDGWPAPPEIMAQRLNYISKKTVATIAGRHHVHLDAPESVAPYVNAFLR